MAYDNRQYGEGRARDSVYTKRVKAGRKRTYYFDVCTTRGNDYYIIITESKRRFSDDGHDRHKTFIYKEDFNKFLAGLTDAINHVKTTLMPNFDFDAYSHDDDTYDEFIPDTARVSSGPMVNYNYMDDVERKKWKR